MAVEQRSSSEVELQARALIDSLKTGTGWRAEHGRMQRIVIIREGTADLESAKRVYERAYEILFEQGYAVRFHFRPHGDYPGETGYVELGICIGR